VRASPQHGHLLVHAHGQMAANAARCIPHRDGKTDSRAAAHGGTAVRGAAQCDHRCCCLAVLPAQGPWLRRHRRHSPPGNQAPRHWLRADPPDEAAPARVQDRGHPVRRPRPCCRRRGAAAPVTRRRARRGGRGDPAADLFPRATRPGTGAGRQPRQQSAPDCPRGRSGRPRSITSTGPTGSGPKLSVAACLSTASSRTTSPRSGSTTTGTPSTPNSGHRSKKAASVRVSRSLPSSRSPREPVVHAGLATGRPADSAASRSCLS
jgi:hypothetical protein